MRAQLSSHCEYLESLQQVCHCRLILWHAVIFWYALPEQTIFPKAILIKVIWWKEEAKHVELEIMYKFA